jgi:hypothetical protein
MAQADILATSTWAVEQPKLQDNFTELYDDMPTTIERDGWNGKAEVLRTEVVAATATNFTLAQLSGTFITNEGQNPANNIANTVAAALVAGLEFTVVITESMNSGVYWQLTVPVGHSILYNGTIGTNGGRARFTQGVVGDFAHFKAITINGSVILLCESSATTLTVT